MKIIELIKNPAKETAEPLDKMGVGQVFRFQHDSFEMALAEGCFFMVIDDQKKDNLTVPIISLDGKSFQRRDKEMRVIRHTATIAVARN